MGLTEWSPTGSILKNIMSLFYVNKDYYFNIVFKGLLLILYYLFEVIDKIIDVLNNSPKC